MIKMLVKRFKKKTYFGEYRMFCGEARWNKGSLPENAFNTVMSSDLGKSVLKDVVKRIKSWYPKEDFLLKCDFSPSGMAEYVISTRCVELRIDATKEFLKEIRKVKHATRK